MCFSMGCMWIRIVLKCLLLVALVASGAHAREASTDAGIVREVALRELPREARETLTLIRRGGPFPYPKDGTVFSNRERLLPKQPRGHYTEYTVPTPGARDRGARRIVAGGDPRSTDEYWYTADHYKSFQRIRE